jgi:hypothetical protein
MKQQVGVMMELHVMEKIDKILYDKEKNIFQKERQLLELMYYLFAMLLRMWITSYDRQQSASMRSKGFTEVKEVERTVTFLFGTITFSRKRWIREKETVYPVDRILGIDRYSRYSNGITVTLARMAKFSTYRAVAEITGMIAPLNISKDTVQVSVHKVGESIKHFEMDELENAYLSEGTKEVEKLIIEADGIMVKSRFSEGGREMLHVLVHEGKMSTKKGAGLVEPREFIGENKGEVKRLAQAYIYNTYRLKNTIVISNSDNGRGVKESFFKEFAVGVKQHFHVLDEYHWNKKIMDRMSFCDELMPKMRSAVYQHSTKERGIVLDTMESMAVNDQQLEHTEKLRRYLRRNWKYLQPLNWRLKPLDVSFKKSDLALGAIESNHKKITYREKKRGMYWGAGAEYLAKIIIGDKQGILEEAYEHVWKKIIEKEEKSTDYLVVSDEAERKAIKTKYAGKTHKVALDRDSERERQELARLFSYGYPH